MHQEFMEFLKGILLEQPFNPANKVSASLWMISVKFARLRTGRKEMHSPRAYLRASLARDYDALLHGTGDAALVQFSLISLGFIREIITVCLVSSSTQT